MSKVDNHSCFSTVACDDLKVSAIPPVEKKTESASRGHPFDENSLPDGSWFIA